MQDKDLLDTIPVQALLFVEIVAEASAVAYVMIRWWVIVWEALPIA